MLALQCGKQAAGDAQPPLGQLVVRCIPPESPEVAAQGASESAAMGTPAATASGPAHESLSSEPNSAIQ